MAGFFNGNQAAGVSLNEKNGESWRRQTFG
jgi:hypothetical protein